MEYPSTKRMKKRRELDALVADKKKPLLKSPGSSLPDRLLKSSLIKPMVIKTRGDHQLLRSQDSESDNEFVAFNRTDHTSALVSNSQKTQYQPKQNQKQSVHEDEADFSFREDADLEGIVTRRRRSCCGESSTKQRPYFYCSRCCHFALVMVCVLGVASLAWMHLGLRREMQTMESRLLRLSFGYTKIPPRIDDVEVSVEDSEKNWKVFQEVKLPELNTSILLVQKRVRSLNESIDALARLNVLQAPVRKEILELQRQSLKLQSDFAAAAEDLKRTKERLAQDREKIKNIFDLRTTMPATTVSTSSKEAVDNSDQAAARLNVLESAIIELKARVADLSDGGTEENDRRIVDDNVTTEYDRTKPGLKDLKAH